MQGGEATLKPILTLKSYTRNRISGKEGFAVSQVVFTCDMDLQAFEARATKEGTPYGVGVGDLLCSMENVASGEDISFSLSSSMLTQGDGVYRVSLYGKANDRYFDFGALDFGSVDFAGEYGEWSDE